MIAYVIYPVVMGIALGIHLFLVHIGVSLELATYAPVILSGGSITVLEKVRPYRSSWKGSWKDFWQELKFIALVQLLLPKLFTWGTLFFVAVWFPAISTIATFWPHHMPVAIQAVWMLLSADLLRYGLHRAAHEWSLPLWRFHAVHHSAKKLHWFNVGRFHPLEKLAQNLFDVLPFLLMGVSSEVLALYFVFYSVNGFFQHCNIEMKLGWLNYVISGPELHRWHHSKAIHESNHNYGNNLIIWDLAFISYHLPKEDEVKSLGLINPDYPQGFQEQCTAPFVGDLDKTSKDS